MSTDLAKTNLHWASVVMRLIIGSLFLAAALTKIPNGISGTVGYYTSLFENSMLPMFLVKIHASVIMIVEFALAAWLFTGVALRSAWIAAALVLISLALGMVFVGQYPVASDNYLYAFLCVVGLVLAPFDRWTLGRRIP